MSLFLGEQWIIGSNKIRAQPKTWMYQDAEGGELTGKMAKEVPAGHRVRTAA